MRGHVAAVGMCLILAACGAIDTGSDLGEDEPPSTTTTLNVPTAPEPQHPPGGGKLPPSNVNRVPIGLVDLGVVDPGQAISSTVWSQDDWREAAGEAAVGDAAIQLTRCHLRAPGEWVIEGSAAFDGSGPVTATLGFDAQWNTDVYNAGVPVSVTLAGPGEFALLVNGFELHRARGGRESLALQPFFRGPTCSFQVGSSETRLVEVPRTLSSDPLEWVVPDDTLQSLGSGIVLSDPGDARMPFAYLAWGQQPFPMPTMWVPDAPGMRLVNVAVMENSVCSLVMFDSSGSFRVSDPEHGIWVSHFRNCDFVDMLVPGRGPATSVPGFTFDETLATRGIVADLDGTLVSVESLSASLEELEAVAESLVPYRNLHAGPPADSATVGDDLDAAIESTLALIDATERGRFSLDGLLVVVATYLDTETTPSSGDIVATSYIVRESDGVYGVEKVSSAGGSDLCVASVFGNTESSGSWLARIGAESDWTMQELVDGEWVDLPTVAGVHFLGSTDTIVDPGIGPFRAIDGNRRVVRCSTYLPLEVGQQWSEWQPPTARNDLPMTVTPDSRLQDGDRVQLVASGFPAEGTVVARMCRLETINWMDALDCEASSGDTAILVQDQAGAVDAAFRVVAQFITELGDVVDCREESCAIRLDSTAGFRRSAVAVVEFAP